MRIDYYVVGFHMWTAAQGKADRYWVYHLTTTRYLGQITTERFIIRREMSERAMWDR